MLRLGNVYNFFVTQIQIVFIKHKNAFLSINLISSLSRRLNFYLYFRDQ